MNCIEMYFMSFCSRATNMCFCAALPRVEKSSCGELQATAATKTLFIRHKLNFLGNFDEFSLTLSVRKPEMPTYSR